MKTILLIFLLALQAPLSLAAQKFSLTALPEALIPKLIQSVQIDSLEVIKPESNETKLKIRVKGQLLLGETKIIINDVFKASLSSTSPDEQNVKLRLYARDLAGPCDYNGFQKINLHLVLDSSLEILPAETGLVLSLYQRALDCSDSYQAFASDFL